MLKKPSGCSGCPLESKGTGFSLPSGPTSAKVLLLGEALGTEEARRGTPFVGAAGGMLSRLLRMAGIDRRSVRIDNVVRCQPPRNFLSGAPWEQGAVSHCELYYSTRTFTSSVKVIVPMGEVPIRYVFGISKKDWTKNRGCKVENFRGTVSWSPRWNAWVVPTYHPSHLQRGQSRLIGVVVHDLKRAIEVASKGHEEESPNLLLDPSPDVFFEWVKACLDSDSPWLAVDIETPEKQRGKAEDELEEGDDSYTITRVNFCYQAGEALTVPFTGVYIDGVRQLISSGKMRLAWWNVLYDAPRLEANGVKVEQPYHDLMDAWHFLQSDVPRGLGFVTSFYHKNPPWKHLSGVDQKRYAALDALYTWGNAVGIERDLKKLGQWEYYCRHFHDLDQFVLRPAEEVGLRFDRDKLESMALDLAKKKQEVVNEVRKLIPDELTPVDKTYKRDPGDPSCEKMEVETEGYRCLTCGKEDIPRTHRCNSGKQSLELTTLKVTRWVKWGEFNPSSPSQVLAYIHYKGHQPGKNKKTHKDTADEAALEALARKTKDPFYTLLLDLRKIDKFKGTYVDGMLNRLDENSRIHGRMLHIPSTQRLSSRQPNLQNMVSDRGEGMKKELAHSFRASMVPDPDCVLIEADFSAIEAVLVGWFAGDPDYIRIAKQSIHAYLTSHIIGKPADLSMSDEDLHLYLKQVKKAHKDVYSKAKVVVHGSSYGYTPFGMKRDNPHLFSTIKSAEELQKLFFSVAPKVKKWQDTTIQLAASQGYLGLDTHPFHYLHYFFDVISYKPIAKSRVGVEEARGNKVVEIDGQFFLVGRGSDAKAALAFYPQSSAGGVMYENCLRLFHPDSSFYIGDAFHGKTPLRMIIHDSVYLEVEKTRVDEVLEKVYNSMTHPVKELPCPPSWNMGTHLTFGCEVKLGKDGANMEEVKF